MKNIQIWVLFLSLLAQAASARPAGDERSSAAKRPPMGWNSYNCFGGNATEQEVKQNADYMAAHLRSFGWEYVVLDFLWYCDDQNSPEAFADRRPEQFIDAFGRLIPSVKNHPSASAGRGLKPLGDYIHSKGLKFGIHIMRGIPRQAVEQNTPILNSAATAASVANPADTCIWYGGLVGVDMTKDGAQAYYNSIFKLYASWGVDFIKVDDISYPYHADEIEAVKEAIEQCGREMVLSLSPGPAFIGNPKHLREHAHMWRISADFWDKWESLVKQLHLCRQWAPFVTEGGWPDADMLPLGHLALRHEVRDNTERYTRFTPNEQYFMMTLWSIFRSPLMMGGHLPDNDAFTLSLLTNEEAIRVNQHSRDNREIQFADGISVWAAEDETDGTTYVAFLNTNDQQTAVSLPLSAIGRKGTVKLRNLWDRSETERQESIDLALPAHGGLLFAVRGGETISSSPFPN